jgi:hypothetical protein
MTGGAVATRDVTSKLTRYKRSFGDHLQSQLVCVTEVL